MRGNKSLEPIFCLADRSAKIKYSKKEFKVAHFLNNIPDHPAVWSMYVSVTEIIKNIRVFDTKSDAIMAFPEYDANLQIRAHFSMTDEDILPNLH